MQEEERVTHIEQRIETLTNGFRKSAHLPVRGDVRNMRGDSSGDNFRQRNNGDAGFCQRSPSYGRNWHHNDSRGSRGIGNPGGALLHISHSVMVSTRLLPLHFNA